MLVYIHKCTRLPVYLPMYFHVKGLQCAEKKPVELVSKNVPSG